MIAGLALSTQRGITAIPVAMSDRRWHGVVIVRNQTLR